MEQYKNINGTYSIDADIPPPAPPLSLSPPPPPAPPLSPPKPEGDAVTATPPTVVQIATPDVAPSQPEVEGKSDADKSSSKASSPVSSLDSADSADSGSSMKETSPDSIQQEATPKTTPKATPPTGTPEDMEVDSVAAVIPSKPSAELAENKDMKSPSVIVYTPAKKEESTSEPMEEAVPKTEGEEKGSVAEGEGGDSKAECPVTEGEEEQSAKTEGKKANVKQEQLKFMFNIADGGFTELHNLWSDEKTKGFSLRGWGRHHDYWLLKGLVTYPDHMTCT